MSGFTEEKMNEILRASDPRFQGLAEEKGYDQSYARIKRLSYTHEAMIDVLISEPTLTQKEVAEKFGRSEAWICRIIGSDAFQGALAKRRQEVIDPVIVQGFEERMKGVAAQSLEVISKNLELKNNPDVALKALDITSKALGFGAKNVNQGQINNNYVVQLPPKSETTDEWVRKNSGSQGAVIEHKSFNTDDEWKGKK